MELFNDPVARRIREAADRGTLSHALLFSGSGDRLSAARDFAAAHRCGLILKGHATVTAAPDGRAWVNVTGNPGMAKGGSGDVLSGIAAGLWGQKHLRSGDSDLWSLAAQAVAIHAACGDLCARELGEYAMTPGDMVRALPKVFKALEPCSGT